MTISPPNDPPDRWEDLIGQRHPEIRPVSAWEHLLSLLGPPICGLCNEPVPSPTASICENCEENALARVRNLSFGQVYSLFAHQEFARRAITGLKYRQERWRGFQLAQHAALVWLSHAQNEVLCDDLLVPIPIHPDKVRARGFNQALVIARGIAQRVPLKVVSTGLARVDKLAADQKHLSRDARLASRGRFRAQAKLRGQRIWLVDDVLTTGATLEDAAGALREIGALPVGGITLNWRP